ncbi:MAG: DUF971 domain-containing protein [Pseudomonadota bacterium]
MSDAAPVEIKLRTKSRCLQLKWADGACHALGFEYLRVHSPSAEVRGHAQGQAVLQAGKRDVRITRIDPVGHYALKLTFSDGHNSGLFTWRYFRELGDTFEARWAQYLHDLDNAGLSRDAAKPSA